MSSRWQHQQSGLPAFHLPFQTFHGSQSVARAIRQNRTIVQDASVPVCLFSISAFGGIRRPICTGDIFRKRLIGEDLGD